MGSLLFVVAVVAITTAIVGTPAYVIAKRREMKNPWVAFVPILGFWIVICESAGQSGWAAAAMIIPMIGLVVLIWMAVAVPPAHERSRLWTLALIVPGLHIIGYWIYAFTLNREPTAPLVDATA
jgi:hypothetical protein